ncbi:hypothetical protein BJY01DRAFT_251307 [Aspergillus pseudoustus]|uniref:ABM domain-containing protein n=1 Tax=Aspergillus pseudoustus TaxID=1810923 RepID=A0ABR4JDI2_9EURO
MKLTGTLLGLAAISAAVAEDFNPNHAVNFAVTMRAKPGKMKQATEAFDKQTAAFRAMNPPGQTALWAYPSGNDIIVTIEQYVNKEAAIAWAVNQTHVDGVMGVIGLMDVFSAKMYSNVNIGLGDILPHIF